MPAEGTRLSSCIAPKFFGVHHALKSGTKRHIWLKGGRGSTKSSFAATELPLFLKRNPDSHAVVLRKVAKDMRGSVYAELQKCINRLGIAHEFRFCVSPMEITYKPTGQKIFFRGVDDAEKAKSFTVPFGYVGIVLFEELDQFSGMEEIRSIRQTLLRGGTNQRCIYCYNPPKSRDSWVNREAIARQGDTDYFVHTSDYRDVDPSWLGDSFFGEIDTLLRTEGKSEQQIAHDLAIYNHEYLGEVIGTGGNVFDNLKVRAITDEEIAQFDRTCCGVDFGWFPHPWVFERTHLDLAQRRLFVFDEDTALRLKNADAATRIKAKLTIVRNGRELVLPETVMCDSAEMKSVADYRDHNLDARPVRKGPGSVAYGMKWLTSLVEIVIDPVRCPLAAQQFPTYEFERTRDGAYTSNYPDVDDDAIDAVRYSVNDPINRRS